VAALRSSKMPHHPLPKTLAPQHKTCFQVNAITNHERSMNNSD
jgi:hypothetical protein